jgi:carbon-monoxide dehydrogenase medium subunit
MKLRLAQPAHLVDLGKIGGLSYIHQEDAEVVVGAMTTYTAIMHSDLLRHHFALLPEGTAMIGDQQVRNRGTIGGSVAHSDPAADMPGIVLALKADIIVQGPAGKRSISADHFFTGLFETALKPNEVVTEIRFVIPPAHTGSAYTKLANKASHYAVAGCAAVVTMDHTGTCVSASVVITGASVKAARAGKVEAALVGNKLDEATVAAAAANAADGLELMGDIHGSKAYRGQMTTVMARRAVLLAASRA